MSQEAVRLKAKQLTACINRQGVRRYPLCRRRERRPGAHQPGKIGVEGSGEPPGFCWRPAPAGCTIESGSFANRGLARPTNDSPRVEGRFPFLDHRVIEFLAGTPEDREPA